VIELKPEALTEYINYLAYVSDGQNPIFVTFLPYVMDNTAKMGIKVFMQGFAFDLLLGGSFLKKEYFKAKNIKELIQFLERNSILFSMDELRCLLGDKLGGLIYDARKEFIKAVISCKGDSFPNKADCFFMKTRVRRFTLMDSVIDREFTEELLPTIADDVLGEV